MADARRSQRMALDRPQRFARFLAGGPGPAEVLTGSRPDRGAVVVELDAEVMAVVFELADGATTRRR